MDEQQFEQRLVEPNSGLGGAMRYMLKHWSELTLFLRKAGAPLDNNVVERALKRAIRHRRNSLFYKTTKGAEVGDIKGEFADWSDDTSRALSHVATSASRCR